MQGICLFVTRFEAIVVTHCALLCGSRKNGGKSKGGRKGGAGGPGGKGQAPGPS